MASIQSTSADHPALPQQLTNEADVGDRSAKGIPMLVWCNHRSWKSETDICRTKPMLVWFGFGFGGSLCVCFLGQNGRVSESPSLKDVQSKAELDKVVRSDAAVSVHFWASWCEASKPMDNVFSHLSTDFPHAHFLRSSFRWKILVLDYHLSKKKSLSSRTIRV
ncbi:hypothetical protein CMV_005324 [Castanea mollissima]|uniref:Thioredoxin domain-containing protein n=1 Tax=Castanea mollissima TaxID=60419 RepID=A0A8J4RQD4_9ROSI|nr:hypothetical protein CMV_005324 [Castanea mollissima]